MNKGLGFTDRLRLAWFAIRGATPAGFSVPFGFGGSGSSRAWKYPKYAEDGYLKCPPVNACINLKMSAASSLRYELELGGEVVDPDKSPKTIAPLFKLLDRPNPRTAWTSFIERFELILNIGGMVYIHKIGTGVETLGLTKRAKTEPELWLLYPHLMKQEFDRSGEVVRYRYGQGDQERTFRPEEILDVRFQDPLSDSDGVSPMASIEEIIDAYNATVTWNRSLMANSAVPAGVLFLPGILGLTRAERKEIREEFKSDYGGATKAGETFISSLDGGDYKTLGTSPRELDWLSGKRDLMREICNAFNVPSKLLNDPETGTYANYAEARKSFYTETVIPEMQLLLDELNPWLAEDYGEDVRIVIRSDHIDVLRDDEDKLFERAQKSLSWTTINDRRKLTGLEEVDDPAANELPNVTVTPAGNLGGGGDGSDGRGATGFERRVRAGARALREAREFDSRSLYPDEETRAASAADYNKRRDAWTGTFEDELGKFFRAQRNRVVDRLDGLSGRSSTSIENRDAYTDAIDDLVNGLDEAGRYADQFGEIMPGLVVQFGQAAIDELGTLGIPFDLSRPEMADLVSTDLVKRGQMINEVTAARLRDILSEGARIGKSHQGRMSDIRAYFQDELPRGRVKAIARTEVGRASTLATLDGYRQAKVEYKEWITARDGGDRHPSDIGLDGQVVDIDAEFVLPSGARGQGPFQTGDPSEDINCRCRVAPLRPGQTPI